MNTINTLIFNGHSLIPILQHQNELIKQLSNINENKNSFSIEKMTNFPEMMGGRVKTLHPIIFGGILARDSDKSETEDHNIRLIDMVVCNLYPFKEAVKKGVSTE